MHGLVGIIIMTAMTSCAPHFLSHRFQEITQDHSTIAVLPFETRLAGFMPVGMSEADIQLLEETESRAFQYAFYHELLRRSRRTRKALSVSVQDHGKTIHLLETNGISIRDSWDMLPEDLARILGVDAVVRARIQKTRLMSDLASLGIDVGKDLIRRIARIPLRSWINTMPTQNKSIIADFALFDAEQSTTLWSIEFTQEADWRRPANEIVMQISTRAIRRFPYRD